MVHSSGAIEHVSTNDAHQRQAIWVCRYASDEHLAFLADAYLSSADVVEASYQVPLINPQGNLQLKNAVHLNGFANSVRMRCEVNAS